MSKQNTYSPSAEVGSVRTRRTRKQRIWIELKKAPVSAWVGILIITFYAVMAIFTDRALR
jgi:peptide/nickel transport system permease protein